MKLQAENESELRSRKEVNKDGVLMKLRRRKVQTKYI